MTDRKVLVIGLDCADPRIVFDEFRDRLPNLDKLMQKGAYGKLRSIIPPITIPAWLCMASGRDPGDLGLYGFRHRKGYSYKDYWIANANAMKKPTVWDTAGEMGKKVCLVGFPPTFPPRPVKGNLVSCFITPGAENDYTYPPELKKEVEGLVGEYIFDVAFRSNEKERIRKGLWEMTEKQFKVVHHLMENKEWDLFWYVCIGTDRLHHAFWKYFDKSHPKYDADPDYNTVMFDYYKMVDDAIGRMLDTIDDDTTVLVVSDHGAKGMHGVVAINEWLAREGYLAIKTKPEPGTKLEKTDIDWARTKAWGWGGYYARIFFNVQGRERMGLITPEELDDEIEALKNKLEAMKDPDGNVMGNKVWMPEDLFEECEGDVPDLMVFFGDLFWRSAGTLGWDQVYLTENDTGPDDAMHDWEGIIICYDPKKDMGGVRLEGTTILDVAPTITKILGGKVPSELKGRPIKELIQ